MGRSQGLGAPHPASGALQMRSYPHASGAHPGGTHQNALHLGAAADAWAASAATGAAHRPGHLWRGDHFLAGCVQPPHIPGSWGRRESGTRWSHLRLRPPSLPALMSPVPELLCVFGGSRGPRSPRTDIPMHDGQSQLSRPCPDLLWVATPEEGALARCVPARPHPRASPGPQPPQPLPAPCPARGPAAGAGS